MDHQIVYSDPVVTNCFDGVGAGVVMMRSRTKRKDDESDDGSGSDSEVGWPASVVWVGLDIGCFLARDQLRFVDDCHDGWKKMDELDDLKPSLVVGLTSV